VIEHINADDLTRSLELGGDGGVAGRGCKSARRMVVRDNDAGGAVGNRIRKNLERMNGTSVNQANRNDTDVQDFVRPIDGGAEKMLADSALTYFRIVIQLLPCGDGRSDIVVGKRRWAHGPKGDIEPMAETVLYWFRLVREGATARFEPHWQKQRSRRSRGGFDKPLDSCHVSAVFDLAAQRWR